MKRRHAGKGCVLQAARVVNKSTRRKRLPGAIIDVEKLEENSEFQILRRSGWFGDIQDVT